METQSLRTPNEAYLRSRRALIFASGLLLVAILVGIAPEAPDGTINLFSVKIKPESIPTVLFVVVLYSIWQFWSSWFVQTDEVRTFFVNRVDIVVTIFIAVASAATYLSRFFLQLLPIAKQEASLFLSVFLATLIGAPIFFYTNSIVRKRFLRKTKAAETHLSADLVGGYWILTFNPEMVNGKKEITFLPDGQIGVGRNENEHRWRIREGTLEILNSEGNVFSRFRYDKERRLLDHTNDPDTQSLRNQKISPASSAPRMG